MPEENLFAPFQGQFVKRVLDLAGVEKPAEMVDMYATILVSDADGGAGFAAKISTVFHVLETKEGVDVEVFTLLLSGGKIAILVYAETACKLSMEDVGVGKITSLILGRENRVLCTKDGFLK